MFRKVLLFILIVAPQGAWSSDSTHQASMDKTIRPLPDLAQGMQRASFAGGCFWCMEGPFEAMDGVESVISGFSGGKKQNPSYSQVTQGGTGHRESVLVTFDPKKVKYEMLLQTFWQNINPTDAGGQFADRGEHYTTAIFYHNSEQKKAAEKSKTDLASSGKFKKPIATAILAHKNFYPAEEYHQDFYKKEPEYYQRYKDGSGRSQFLKDNWKK